MNKTDGTKIYLTRGDTLRRQVVIQNEDGSDYQAADGDRVRFALKKDYEDPEPLILKEIPTDTMILELRPEDTKPLAFGDYVYDIELTKANGDVDTFIACACMKIMREVY